MWQCHGGRKHAEKGYQKRKIFILTSFGRSKIRVRVNNSYDHSISCCQRLKLTSFQWWMLDGWQEGRWECYLFWTLAWCHVGKALIMTLISIYQFPKEYTKLFPRFSTIKKEQYHLLTFLLWQNGGEGSDWGKRTCARLFLCQLRKWWIVL